MVLFLSFVIAFMHSVILCCVLSVEFCCARSVHRQCVTTPGELPRPASPAGPDEQPHTRWGCPYCSWTVESAIEPDKCRICDFSVTIDPVTGEQYGSFVRVVPYDGACIACGDRGHAGEQCLTCGGPIEPDDGSFHYNFGWVAGPRPPPPPSDPPTPPPDAPQSPPHA